MGRPVDFNNPNRGRPRSPKPETRLVRTFGSPKKPLDDGEHVSTAQTWVSHFATCPNAAEHRRPR